MAQSQNNTERVEPVFFKHNSIFPNLRGREANILKPLEVYKTVKRVLQSDTVFGAQKIRNLWRIYLKRKPESHAARIKLLTTGMSLRGTKVVLFDKNPYANNEHNAEKANKENIVIVTFKDLPLSYDNSVLEGYLKDYHPEVKLRTQIMYSCERDDVTGYLTDCKNGDRFVKVEGPLIKPLPPTAAIGMFTCRIYHPKQDSHAECWICGEKGHKAGSKKCPHYQDNNDITNVHGHANILSNFHPSKITIDEREHKSGEHAWAYMKASRNGFTELAEQVANAEHAGIAKRLTKDVDTTVEPDWNTHRLDLMEALLLQKMSEHKEFGEALLGSGTSSIAHSVPDKFWGTGLSPQLTQVIKPEFWPGENHYGKILMKIRSNTTHIDGQNKGDDTESHPDSIVSNASGESSSVMPSHITAEPEADMTSGPSTASINPSSPNFPPPSKGYVFKGLVQAKLQFTPSLAVKRHLSGSPQSPERLREIKAAKSGPNTEAFDIIPEGNIVHSAVT